MYYTTSKADAPALEVSVVKQDNWKDWRYAIKSGYGLTIYLDEKEANSLLFQLNTAIADANGEGLPE